jgi:anaerobic selenocysteine-containing dehydrogenase
MYILGKAALEFHNHPARLKYLIRRVGEKGEGKWQRITWDEALDTG